MPSTTPSVDGDASPFERPVGEPQRSSIVEASKQARLRVLEESLEDLEVDLRDLQKQFATTLAAIGDDLGVQGLAPAGHSVTNSPSRKAALMSRIKSVARWARDAVRSKRSDGTLSHAPPPGAVPPVTLDDRKGLATPGRGLVVGMACPLESESRIEDFLLLSRRFTQVADLRFVLYGVGSQSSRVKQLVKKLSAGNVELLVAVDQARLEFSGSQILVATSETPLPSAYARLYRDQGAFVLATLESEAVALDGDARDDKTFPMGDIRRLEECLAEAVRRKRAER